MSTMLRQREHLQTEHRKHARHQIENKSPKKGEAQCQPQARGRGARARRHVGAGLLRGHALGDQLESLRGRGA